MLKYSILLMFIFFGLTANAQFAFQGTSPINDTVDQAVASTYSKNLIFKNNGPAAATFTASLVGPDASKFKIAINRCATTPTAKGKTCQVTIDAQRSLPKRVDPYIVGFDTVTINLTVTSSVAPPPLEPVPPVSAFSITPDPVPLMEFATGELNKSITLTITNNGELEEQPSVVIDSAGSLVLSFLINRCTTPVPVGKNCSVQIRANNPPSATVISKMVKVYVGAIEKDSVTISASQTNLCAANSKKSCVIANAQTSSQTCAADGKSYGSCTVESCLSTHYLSNNQCLLITYSATFSEYNPLVPQNQVACDGTVNSARTIVECKRTHDNVVVASSFCSDPSPTVSSQSPPGNKDVTILNGKEVYSCLQGSSTESYVDRICNEGFYNDFIMCALTQYVATFADYSPEVPAQNLVCDGTTISNRTINDCRQSHDNALVDNSLCTDPTPQVITTSPAGQRTFAIANGSEERSCELGSSVQTFVSRSCIVNYFDDGDSCEDGALASYTPTFSPYAPEIPVGQVACDGTVTSTRTIETCIRDADGASVSVAFCSDPSPTVITESPEGSKDVNVSNGFETYTCPLGSNVQTFISRTCNIGFSNNGIGCVVSNYATSISLGSESSFILSSSNSVYGWGFARIFTPTTVNVLTSKSPIVFDTSSLGADKIKSLHSGNSKVCGVTLSNEGYCWWTINYINQVTSTSMVSIRDNDSDNYLLGKTIKTFVSGGFNCLIASDDKAYCWGTNSNGELGNSMSTGDSTRFPITPVSMPGGLSTRTVQEMGSGSSHACFIDSTGKVYCWGLGNEGRLGTGNQVSVNFPVAVNMSSGVLALKTAKSIAVGQDHTCVIASDDKVYCWGNNANGQLGNNTNTNATNPVAVSMNTGVLAGKTAKSITAGYRMTCIIASDDKAYCWGLGNRGQLGNASTQNALVPVAVSMTGDLVGKTIKSIEASKSFQDQINRTCFITSEDKVYCFGGNQNGYHLGTISISTESSVPVLVDPLP